MILPSLKMLVISNALEYPNATECLRKDEDVVFTFYDFLADYWIHLRTTNQIESTFAKARQRTRQTTLYGSRTAMLDGLQTVNIRL
jgi:putative transposase